MIYKMSNQYILIAQNKYNSNLLYPAPPILYRQSRNEEQNLKEFMRVSLSRMLNEYMCVAKKYSYYQQLHYLQDKLSLSHNLPIDLWYLICSFL